LRSVFWALLLCSPHPLNTKTIRLTKSTVSTLCLNNIAL